MKTKKSLLGFDIPLYNQTEVPLSPKHLFLVISSPKLGECSLEQMADCGVSFKCPQAGRPCEDCVAFHYNAKLELKAIKKQKIKLIKELA